MLQRPACRCHRFLAAGIFSAGFAGLPAAAGGGAQLLMQVQQQAESGVVGNVVGAGRGEQAPQAASRGAHRRCAAAPLRPGKVSRGDSEQGKFLQWHPCFSRACWGQVGRSTRSREPRQATGGTGGSGFVAVVAAPLRRRLSDTESMRGGHLTGCDGPRDSRLPPGGCGCERMAVAVGRAWSRSPDQARWRSQAARAWLPVPASSRSLARSAIITVGALVLPPGSTGMTEASTTRRASTPRTRNSLSTTA